MLKSFDFSVFGTLLLAFIIVVIVMPSIVRCAHSLNLYDRPGRRKSHHNPVPNIGGIAVFIGVTFAMGTSLIILPTITTYKVLTGFIMIFFIGLYDDVMALPARRKLLGEILAAVIVVIAGNVRFTSLQGFMGIGQIGYVPSILLSMFVLVVIINALNLIDGIDGLASGIGIMAAVALGIWFLENKFINQSLWAASLAGSLTAFFGFNVFGKKNKIFLGDTGSLIVGLLIGVLVIKFNEFNLLPGTLYRVNSAPAISFGILALPMVDTLRVFYVRMANGTSPFRADKNHLHHKLLRLGFTHLQATMTLVTLNSAIIILCFLGQNIGIHGLLVMIFSIMISFTLAVRVIIRERKLRTRLAAFNRLLCDTRGLPRLLNRIAYLLGIRMVWARGKR